MKLFRLVYWPMLVLAAVLVACADDDTFTTSPRYRLNFSADTIALDTTFARVPTPTKSFWVYNRSGDGLRCASVRLDKGNQTGYRVNVDGTFLGSSQGHQTTGVEIRNKDSLRVFVELTAPENGKDEPQLLEDDLVFLLESGVEQRVHLRAMVWDADLLSNVVVGRDSLLDGVRPTVIYGGLRVDSGATLRIAAGKTLYFHAGAGIDVYGRLLCEGTALQNVTLRGDRLDRMFDYLPYDGVSGQWDGIRFRESSYGNEISFTDIHGTFDGIVCDSADVERTKLEMNSCTVHNCQGAGLKATDCLVNMVNCQISNTLGNCVDLLGGNVLLQHCTLAQFYPFDYPRGAALQFANGTGHPLMLYCVNSLVTGDAEDVVMGESADSTATFDYLFVASVLRTPEVDDSLRFQQVVWENPEDTTTGAARHFRLVDNSRQSYDFHLDSLSTAIGKADAVYAIPTDRDGRERDEEPDVGCYEYRKE